MRLDEIILNEYYYLMNYVRSPTSSRVWEPGTRVLVRGYHFTPDMRSREQTNTKLSGNLICYVDGKFKPFYKVFVSYKDLVAMAPVEFIGRIEEFNKVIDAKEEEKRLRKLSKTKKPRRRS